MSGFEVTEKLAAIDNLYVTATVENIFKRSWGQNLDEYNLKCNLLRCTTTDGSKNICRGK